MIELLFQGSDSNMQGAILVSTTLKEPTRWVKAVFLPWRYLLLESVFDTLFDP